MGIVAKADKGWTDLDEEIEAAKGGQNISIATLSPQHDDAVYVIGKHYGVGLNVVRVKGGTSAMNALVAGIESQAGGDTRLRDREASFQ